MTAKSYEQTLLNRAQALDNATNSQGLIIECATNIIENLEDSSTKQLCAIINRIAESKDPELIAMAKSLKDSLVYFYGHRELVSICQGNEKSVNDQDLGSLIQELNGLVGLSKVKEKVNDLIAYQKVQMLRLHAGLSNPASTLHLAFIGNPGTGKTTVARIVGRIYKQIGLLSSGHFLEVSRTDLIAGYQGQTAHKVKKVIEKAKGGVLFIDEAYSITENDHSDSYGRECLTELTKALEDYRNDLVVIVAGYTEPMKKFFESNPGLKSRFNTFIEFDDYSKDELIEIMKVMCEKEDYNLSNEVLDLLNNIIEGITENKEEQFANGRFMRNIFEEMIMNHARRVNQLISPSIDDLQSILACDIPKNIISSTDKKTNDQTKVLE